VALEGCVLYIQTMEIWTDGSCLGNPGFGGWGAISEAFEISGASSATTNNIMELTAVLRALERCIETDVKDVIVWTDSFYVKNGITSWVNGWKRNGWKTSNGQPVKNKQLWMDIDAVARKMHSVEWRWVKAHNGHPQNEAVDALARGRATALKKSSSPKV